MSDGKLEIKGVGTEDFTDWDGKKSPIKAIRAKCLDCCCDQREEVKLCQVKGCPLYPFRMGKNPFRIKRVMSEEQKFEAGERLRKARENR